MTEPSLQKASAISLIAHLVFFAAAAILGKAGFMRHESKTYIVNLITPAATQSLNVDAPQAPAAPEQPSAEQPKAEQKKQQAPPPKKETRKPKAEQKQAQPKAQKQPDAKEAAMALKSTKDIEAATKRREEYIKSLQQKQFAEERSREAVSDIATQSKLKEIQARASAKGKDTGYTGAQIEGIQNAYAAKIQTQIERNWIYPDTGVQYVECSVSITVKASGALIIRKIEQPSGNRTFDQSTLKAIKKTATVEPPPFGEELDVVLKFIPKK